MTHSTASTSNQTGWKLFQNHMVFTPKALSLTAQGRESASAPWVAIDDQLHTLKGFHNG